MTADDVLDEMANAFNDAWDLGCKTEDQLRAALRVLYRETEFAPPHVLQGLLGEMANPQQVARNKALLKRGER